MKTLILCAGAIGTVYAGLLQNAGHDVTALGRKWHIDAIKEKGIAISGIWGDYHADSVTVVSNESEIGNEKFELIILSVKSYDTIDTAKIAQRHLSENGYIVSLQNGVDNAEKIAEFINPSQMIVGRIQFGSQIIEPGHAKVTVMAYPAELGSYKNGVEFSKVEEIVKILKDAGIPSNATKNVNKYLWGKLLYNSALNAPCSILDIPYGDMLGNEYTESLMKGIVEEIFMVAKLKGIELFWQEPDEYLEVLFGKEIPATKAHYPSMLQDIRANKKTEIDSLNGVVVKYAEQMGLSAPVNDCIVKLVKSIEVLKGK